MKKFGIQFKEERPKKYYAEVLEKDFLNAVKRLYIAKGRFITATAYQNSGQIYPVRNRSPRGGRSRSAGGGKAASNGAYIFYHFEINKSLYTLWVFLKKEKAESISFLYPIASWIEREMAELYGIKFQTKNQKYKIQKPLLLTPDIRTPFQETDNKKP